MNTKERAYQLIDRMSDEQLSALINFIDTFTFVNEDFNEDTQRVLDDVKNGRNLSRPFYSVEELMEDLNADD